MKLTQKQVEQNFRNEAFELVYATEAQIDKLCNKLDDDLPRMLWDSFNEDVTYMLAEVKGEFGYL